MLINNGTGKHETISVKSFCESELYLVRYGEL